MSWLSWTIVAGCVISFLLLRRVGLVTPAKAREALRTGARVIDVRSEGEFQAGHLTNALNIPLDRLESEIVRHAPDKKAAILLHCLSGTRSGIGKGILKRLGYGNVYNLGSLGRARRIIDSR